MGTLHEEATEEDSRYTGCWVRLLSDARGVEEGVSPCKVQHGNPCHAEDDEGQLLRMEAVGNPDSPELREAHHIDDAGGYSSCKGRWWRFIM